MEKKKETALVIGAHFDDTAYCWVTWVQMMLKQNKQVEEAVFTDSNYDGIGLIRESEQLDMMKILGMGMLHTIGKDKDFKDGLLKDVLWGLMFSAIKKIIDEAKMKGQPITSMVTFGPEGFTGHPDHIELAKVVEIYFHSNQNRTVKELWQVGMSPKEREKWPKDYFFPIPFNDLNGFEELRMDQKLFHLKAEAIKAHQSQFEIEGGGGQAQIARMPHSEWFKVYRRK